MQQHFKIKNVLLEIEDWYWGIRLFQASIVRKSIQYQANHRFNVYLRAYNRRVYYKHVWYILN